MTRDESVYLGRLTRLGCIVCREYCKLMKVVYEPPDASLQQTVIHHVRAGQGGQQRAEHMLTIPLCVADHAGKHGMHGDKGRIRFLKLTEMDVLALTLETYFDTYGF